MSLGARSKSSIVRVNVKLSVKSWSDSDQTEPTRGEPPGEEAHQHQEDPLGIVLKFMMVCVSLNDDSIPQNL